MSETIRKHKVGSFTLGIALIFFGILFILRSFTKIISYSFVLKLWPLIFIFLGIEILISSITHREKQYVYDKGAIFLLILLSFFAMAMAGAEFIISYHWIY